MIKEEFRERIEKAKEASIVDYLFSKGFSLNPSGSKYNCLSPFSWESNPSMYIYPKTNSFYDFSSGKGGDIITLVRNLEEVSFGDAINLILNSDFEKALIEDEKSKAIHSKRKKFKIRYYFARQTHHVRTIKAYAQERRINHGYFCGRFMRFNKEKNGYEERSGVGFVLRDSHMKICGVKFRAIDGAHPKYELRGEQGSYILENVYSDITDETPLFICESETSANSPWSILNDNAIEGIVVSFGGVNTHLEIPDKYDILPNRYIIIDYDGDENKYKERLESYNYLDCRPITLELEKGEDINSLYANRKEQIIVDKIERLLGKS
jgi:hypothetical protein